VAFDLFRELKRRNVLRVVGGYIVLAWLMAQVSELVLDTFGAPDWVMKTLLALFLIGLPFAAYFAWAFELTPEGVKREGEVEREHSITRQTGRKLDRAIIIMLLLAVAWFAWDRYRPLDVNQPGAAVAEQGQTNDATGVTAGDALPVIAVLPFKATGSDDGGFLADGLHDDLLTRLAKLDAFRVISRTSMMEYADRTKNMRQIGQELGAGYILEGGVQAIGDRVRINAQLIDAQADQHLWAEIYDRQLSAVDLFEVQSELALAIAGALHTVLSPGDDALMNDVPTENLEAYNAYLRGLQKREAWGSFGGAAPIREGIAAYEEAVQLDPDFAEAWAQLSITRSFAFQYFGGGNLELANAAMTALIRARQLKPGLLEVEIALAQYIYRVLREYRLALDEMESLGDRIAGNAYALSMMAWLHRRLGQFDDAYETLLEALKLEPRNVDTLGNVVDYAIRVDDCEAATRYTEQVLSLVPDLTPARAQAAQYELECNGDAAAAAELLQDLDLTDNFGAWVLAFDTAFHVRDGESARMLVEDNWPGTGPLSPVFRELCRAQLFQSLTSDEAAARKAMEAAGLLLAEAGLDDDLEKSEGYAQARLYFHSQLGEAEPTRQWIAEHKRRYREEYKGDLAQEALNRLDYATALSDVGLYDEAVEELRIMLEEPGGHRFPYVDGFPWTEALEKHPGYVELGERFGESSLP